MLLTIFIFCGNTLVTRYGPFCQFTLFFLHFFVIINYSQIGLPIPCASIAIRIKHRRYQNKTSIYGQTKDNLVLTN
jgi:ABC-type tungstate transport system substrate-binding protein